jgi:hypothetical protein
MADTSSLNTCFVLFKLSVSFEQYFVFTDWTWANHGKIKYLRKKFYLSDLKDQFVPRSKHFTPLLRN